MATRLHPTKRGDVGRFATLATRQPSEAPDKPAAQNGGSYDVETNAGNGTRPTMVYSSDATAKDPACQNHPEWAGLTCKVFYGTTGKTPPTTAPAGGAPNTAGSSGTLPSTVTTYNQWLQPLIVAEYTGKDGATALVRTTTTHYDAAGRPDKTTLTTAGAVPGSLPVSATGTVYDDKTGAVKETIRYAADGQTKVDSDMTSYDDWGRTVSYRAAGETSATTTAYDAAGRVATVTAPQGSTSYGYDQNNPDGTPYERRGLTRTVTIHTADTSAAGAVPDLVSTGTYDAAGALTSETFPGGVARQVQYDQVGQLDSMQWTGDVTAYTTSTDPTTGAVTYTPGATTHNQPWLGWTQDRDSAGRVAHEWTPTGSAFTDSTASSTGANNGTPGSNGDTGNALGYDRRYTYDRAGRLTTVYDRTASTTGSTPDPTTGAYTSVACQTRSYTFDGNGNRLGVTLENAPTTSTQGSASSGCPTGDGTSGGAKVVKSWAGKIATTDRLTAAASIASTNDTSGGAAASTATTGGGSYVYDALGRATTIPNADTPNGATGLPGVNGSSAGSVGDLTATYFDTDAVASLSQGGTTTRYTLDVAGRRATQSQQPTTGPNAGTPTDVVTRHYTDTSDNPGWVDHTVTTGSGAGSTAVTTRTRYAETLGGDLSYTVTSTPGTSTGPDVELPVSNPHGDTVTTITLPLTGIQSAGNLAVANATCIGAWTDTDEYGNPTATSLTSGSGGSNSSAAAVAAKSGGVGYGWLGGKQRATDPTSGLILMGARLYSRVTGQFSSTDPIYGGNSTPYAYPQDPVNGFDLDGKCWGWGCDRVMSWGHSKWNGFTQWGRDHKRGLNRLGRALGVISTVAGLCPLAQCQAVALGAGLASAGAYAWAGNGRKASRALFDTGVGLLTGGRGKWLSSSSRFAKYTNSRLGGVIGASSKFYGGMRGWHHARVNMRAWATSLSFTWLYGTAMGW